MTDVARRVRFLLLCLLAGCGRTALAAETAAPDPLFAADDTLRVTITAPMTTLIKERDKEDYLGGTFRLAEAGKPPVDFDLEIRTRGNFRHKECEFPPLSLNFKKSQTAGTLLDRQDKLKLVVHCDDSERYEQVVLREHLVYKMLNALMERSFRVRLLRVTYIDSEGSRDEQTRYGFLIEHKNRLAARFGLDDLELARTSVDAIDGAQLNLTSIFEYMIGNTDFSPVAGAPGRECCHNYVLLATTGAPMLAIPYDFDQSGFVNAPYARPNEQLPIRNVRQRLYRGRCVNNEHVEASLQRFRERRGDIYAAITAQDGLTDRNRKSATAYIDSFYKLINDPRDVQRRIINACV